MRHTLGKAGVVCDAWDCWEVAGRTIRPCAGPGAAATFAEAVLAAKWRRLAKHKSVLHGLHDGRDDEVVLLVDRARRSPIQIGMPWIIQSDSVYTSAQAHLRWGYDAGCPLLHRRLPWGTPAARGAHSATNSTVQRERRQTLDRGSSQP